MRFRTRAFLLCFVPFSLLLTGSFWAIQNVVQSSVRNNLRESLRENHLSIARLRSRTDLRNSRFLRVAGENASLKAGLQLLLSNPADSSAGSDALRTVEDQLGELCGRMGFDFLLVSDPRGKPLAAVIRSGDRVSALDATPLRAPERGLLMLAGKIYQIASVPVDQGEENLGSLSVGEIFDFSGFSAPAVLIHNGAAIRSSIPGISLSEAGRAFAACSRVAECDVRLGGAMYFSLPLQNISFGDGYVSAQPPKYGFGDRASSRGTQRGVPHCFDSGAPGCAGLQPGFFTIDRETDIGNDPASADERRNGAAAGVSRQCVPNPGNSGADIELQPCRGGHPGWAAELGEGLYGLYWSACQCA